MIIRFLKSPTGKYKLAYNAGDVVSLDDKLANIVVADGWGEIVYESNSDTDPEPIVEKQKVVVKKKKSSNTPKF